MQKNSIDKIMVKDVVSIDRYTRFSDLRKILEHYDFHHLPVIDDGNRLIGMVSATDILKHSLSASFFAPSEVNESFLDRNISVNTIMQTQMVTVPPTTEIHEAAKILYHSKFNCLPVVDDDNLLMGIVTTKDLVGQLIGA